MKTVSRILISIILISLFPEVSAQGVKLDFGHKINIIENNSAWKYHHGDDTAWASPSFNDSKWDTINPDSYSDETKGYTGMAWFRYTVNIYDSLRNKPLAFVIEHMGASEIYVDGKLIKQFGTVSSKKEEEIPYNPKGEPVNFVLDKAGEHLISVRYSNHLAEHNLKTYNEDFSGFNLDIQPSESAREEYTISILVVTLFLALGIGFFIALGLLHFVLFLFYKSELSNLYYSLFTISLSFYCMTLWISLNINSPSYILSFRLITGILGVLNLLSLLALVYSFFYTKMPKRFWVVVSLVSVYVVIAFTKINWAEYLSIPIVMAIFLDVCRLIIKGFLSKYDPDKKLKKRWKYYLLILVLILIVCGFINMMIPLVILAILVALIVLPVLGSIFIVPIYMSIRHARNFSSTNKNLLEQLQAVKELSAKTLEQEKEKQKIIEAQKESLEIQVEERTLELSRKNQEITDSINYAQRIQKAILPPFSEVKAALPHSFILFKPKDIVSGDFYWFHNPSPSEKGRGDVLIAACDCTGHGVPGAFMSTIGSEKLNEAVKESNDVAVILNLINRGMKKVLRQSDKTDSTRDGMDIALCSFNKEMTKLEYAGANRPLWIVRGSLSPEFIPTKEGGRAVVGLLETKATKVAIGGHTDDDQVFTKHSVDLHKGDTVYIFTDGFADQFSQHDKKLMTKKFKEALLSINDKSMEEQKEYLDTFIENWKGAMEQTDDILVIGVKID